MKRYFFPGNFYPALIIGGIFAAITVFVSITSKDSGTILFFIILTTLIITSLINFSFCNKNCITFFSFFFVPARFRWDQIAEICCVRNPKNSALSSLIIYLKNGEKKQIKLGLYPSRTAEQIAEIMAENTPVDPEYYRNRERLDFWLGSARKKNPERIVFLCGLMIIAAALFQVKTWYWNWKTDGWKTIHGTVEVNQENEYRYSYTYQGKQYKGNQILENGSVSSQDKPGTPMICLVNPEKPEESAAISRMPEAILRKVISFLLTLFAVPILLLSLLSLAKKIKVPDSLKDYTAGFEPEEIKRISHSICGECKISIATMESGFCEIEGRYGCFPPSHSVTALIIMMIIFCGALFAGRYIMPHFFVLSIIMLILMWRTLFPRNAVFDNGEKKICWSRFFSCKSVPEKLNRNDILNETDLVALGLTYRNDNTVMLSGVRKDGIYIPIVKANINQMEQLFNDTVKIAERLGRIPVITI